MPLGITALKVHLNNRISTLNKEVDTLEKEADKLQKKFGKDKLDLPENREHRDKIISNHLDVMKKTAVAAELADILQIIVDQEDIPPRTRRASDEEDD